MKALIENPAASEIESVIRFLNAKNVKVIDIHWQFWEVYKENEMSDSVVRRWAR